MEEKGDKPKRPIDDDFYFEQVIGYKEYRGMYLFDDINQYFSCESSSENETESNERGALEGNEKAENNQQKKPTAEEKALPAMVIQEEIGQDENSSTKVSEEEDTRSSESDSEDDDSKQHYERNRDIGLTRRILYLLQTTRGINVTTCESLQEKDKKSAYDVLNLLCDMGIAVKTSEKVDGRKRTIYRNCFQQTIDHPFDLKKLQEILAPYLIRQDLNELDD